jgi:hypothetical protein
MTLWYRHRLAAWTLGLGLLAVAAAASAQAPVEAPAPPPPELQRLVELAKDPDKIRELMSDPDRLAEVMRTMESEKVQEFLRDPERVRELMSQIDLGQIRDAVQAVDRSAIRKAMAARWKQRLKEMLKVADEEWKALEPKIDNLVRAQQEARAGIRGGMRGGFGGGFAGVAAVAPPPLDREGPSEVEEAAEDVREAAADPDLPGAEVARRLNAYRKARDKAREKLDAAERDLRDLLTQRQEAVLTIAGMLR